MKMEIMLYVVAFIVLVIIIAGLRIAQEYQRSVVFRLGRYTNVRGPGVFLMIPFLERQVMVDMRTRTVSVEQQETITKDSVTIKVNAVLWFRIIEPEKSILKVANAPD